MTRNPVSIWIGYDPREAAAFAVARHSIRRRLTVPIPIYGLVLDEVIEAGLYSRPTKFTKTPDGHTRMTDVLSMRSDYDGAMSTQFAISRFLVPHLVEPRSYRGVDKKRGWALFMDCDMLVRTDLSNVFELADDRYAMMCVKHKHVPSDQKKMDGQVQTQYARKNWSSFMLFNCDHEANKDLTLDLINKMPGRDLHRMCWLDDEEIGELDPTWNWLAEESDPIESPHVVHFTKGGPWFAEYQNVPFAHEWYEELADWARR